SAVQIVLQDHAGKPPAGRIGRATLRAGMRKIDAVSFAARELANPWIATSMIRSDIPILELMEGSSRFNLQDQAEARSQTGLSGRPLCVWVGRLNANTDPVTVLAGFERALATLPDARLAMVYQTDELLPAIRDFLAERSALGKRVCLLGGR